jgi:PAS domain S-box-containing protein
MILKNKDIPIRQKLKSIILITTGLSLTLMCPAYVLIEYYSFKDSIRKNITVLAGVIASNLSGAVAFESEEDATETLQALKSEPHIQAACIYNNEGKILAKYPITAEAKLFPKYGRNSNGFYFKEDYLEGYQIIQQKGAPLGLLYLKVDLEEMYSQLWKFVFIGIFLIAGSLLMAAILSRILEKCITEPILALERKARIISEQKDFKIRAEKYSNDEVGALTDAFNLMLNEIQSQNFAITSFNLNLEQKVRERTAALQEQKDFIETIINSSVDLIAVFDCDLNYIMVNERANDYYPIQRSKLEGNNLLDVFPQMKGSILHQNLLEALEGKTIHDKNYYSRIVDRKFENFYIPLKNLEQEVYGVLLVGHDITDLIKTKDKLEKLNSELLKSNRDLEQFAYIASHDLQEPLRKIQTFTQLLLEQKDPIKQEIYQHKINQAAGRMQQLIRDVLNFSRINNNGDAFKSTNLNEIVINLLSDFELLIKEKKVKIEFGQLPTIPAIPLQMTQLFSNLISNSIKYNERQPEIHIQAHHLGEEELKNHPRLEQHGNYVQIKFSDNGIGFDNEFREQIFQIFQRLHGKNTYSGTGIGLALCKKIVENHQGIIFADSQPGIGTVFTIILPGERKMLSAADNQPR